MKLKGRNAIITGATQGLGRAILEAYLREGANVTFCARQARDVDKTLADLTPGLAAGQKLIGLSADVARDEDINRLFSAAKVMGDLHILVNNAGIYGPIGPIEELDPSAWKSTFETNVFSIMLAARKVIPGMKQQGYGKLIQISGGGAAPIPNCSAYTVTKMAVSRLTEALAEELRAWNIDSNAIAPGPLNTRLIRDVLDAGPERAGADFYSKNLQWSQGKAVPPELGADVAVYLGSAESDGITGKLLAAQWDPWQDLQRHKEELAGDIYTFRRIVPKDRGQTWGD
ncbi:MAG: SDR family oxidoreductase [Verrucomicrobiaceae bacterium]|nr:MAG: SDR family oxidoreductase [Verrucomicrobiaceae bacterium]